MHRQMLGLVRVSARDAPHSLDVPIELQEQARLFVPDDGVPDPVAFHGYNGTSYIFPVRVPGSSSDDADPKFRTLNGHITIIAYVNRPPPLSDRHRMFTGQVDGRPAMGVLSYTYLEKMNRQLMLQEVQDLRKAHTFLSGVHFATGIKSKMLAHMSDTHLAAMLAEPEIRDVMAFSPATGMVVFVDESKRKYDQ